MGVFDDTPYTTVEAVFLEDDAGFWDLVPHSQVLADGADGAIAVNSWVLTSAKNFATQGVAAGDLVHVEGTEDTGVDAMGPSGADFLVDSVSGTSITLRRPGLASGVGEPPGAATALSNLEFKVGTVRPQLDTASNWVARRLNHAADADLVTADDLAHVTKWRVLERLNWGARREPGDHFENEAKLWAQMLEMDLTELAGRRRSEHAVDYIEVVPRDYPTEAEVS